MRQMRDNAPDRASGSRTSSRAIIALATNATLYEPLRTGARATAEALTWDRELDRLDVSYREVYASRTT